MNFIIVLMVRISFFRGMYWMHGCMEDAPNKVAGF
jgi:hypothetical protein